MKSKYIIALMTVSCILSSIVTYYFCKQDLKIQTTANDVNITQAQAVQSNNCSYKIGRLKGYKFIRPLQYAEPECEGSQFFSLKINIQNEIEKLKNSGSIISASVYLRDFDKANWINVNPEEKYHPASLLKLALLITTLKMEEKTPGFLNKNLTFFQKSNNTKIQTFNSKQIQVGNSYTIKELLQYMVSYSDNNATNLLHDVMDWEEYKKTFDYLGIAIPDVYKVGYTISAKDYSIFLKVLFNGAYLNYNLSEFAFELLTKTDFKDGFTAGLPEGTIIAHKFGEWTDGKSVHQLHESGIIYLNGKAYLLTIMTSGNSVQKLTEVLAKLTKIVFDHLDTENLVTTTKTS